MATQPTQNAVPSESPRDLKFNAGKIDEFVTSFSQQYIDRFGKAHYTIEGLKQLVLQQIYNLGWNLRGSFQDGGTVTSAGDLLQDESTNIWYRWDDLETLPKTVPSGSTPASAGGTGVGKWQPVDISDVLRKQISDPDGATKYPELQMARWRDTGDIRGWGAVQGEDATDAINAAIRDRGANDWGTSSDVIINGHYKVEGQVLLTTDVRIIGNWATITSSSNDWIIISAYKDQNGDIVNNFDNITDEQVIASARLKGVQIKGITFVGVSKSIKLQAFTERCILEDLSFQNCGIAWDARLSFYSKYSNIIIRGVKSGFENNYAYQLRHQCNDIKLSSITIVGRKFGRLIDDDVTPTMPGAEKNCQNVVISGCSYEQIDNGAKINISTYGYTENEIYAENVNDNLFIFDNGQHYDTVIDKCFWCYGVEKLGTFNNLKGRSVVWQPVQHNYTPPKRSAVQFVNSTCIAHPATGMGAYHSVGSTDYGISWDSTSKITFNSFLFTQEGAPVNLNQTNLVNIPVNISGFVPLIANKALGITGATYTSSSDTLNMSTDIYWSNNNFVLVAIRVFQTSNPTNSHSATALLMNGYKSQLAGQPVTYVKDGDLTTVRITNPSEGGYKTWLINGDFTVEGCVRVL